MSNRPHTFSLIRESLASGALAENLKPLEIGVWHTIALHARIDTHEAWVGSETLGRMMGLQPGSARRIRRRLVDAGWLIDTGRLAGQRGAKVFRVIFKTLPARDALEPPLALPPGNTLGNQGVAHQPSRRCPPAPKALPVGNTNTKNTKNHHPEGGGGDSSGQVGTDSAASRIGLRSVPPGSPDDTIIRHYLDVIHGPPVNDLPAVIAARLKRNERPEKGVATPKAVCAAIKAGVIRQITPSGGKPIRVEPPMKYNEFGISHPSGTHNLAVAAGELASAVFG